jgi:hypothetical protein
MCVRKERKKKEKIKDRNNFGYLRKKEKDNQTREG